MRQRATEISMTSITVAGLDPLLDSWAGLSETRRRREPVPSLQLPATAAV